ncbi:MAG: sortase [Chloroflexi bacterium]|nr:sortase [Chloroflexota bacterium]
MLMAAGGLAILIGGVVSIQAWYAGRQWRASPEAAQAQRNVEAPTPIWITPAPRSTRAPAAMSTTVPTATSARAAGVTATQPATEQPLAPPAAPGATDTAEAELPAQAPQPTVPPPATPTPVPPTPTLGPSELRLASATFQFDDPPQPGARARLDFAVHNPTDQDGGPVTLLLPQDWLKGYQVDDTDPATTTSPSTADNTRRLTFDGPAAGGDVDIEVRLETTEEVIDAPAMRVVDRLGREIGRAQPSTEAPPAQPGPVYSIDIPRLNLKTGVVQVEWEPPLFVVGQLRNSAHVTQGNSVLVGHVRGAPGYNVFDHLDQLQVGDDVIASSRGETYNFVVSSTQVLPEGDMSPTDATDTPRLTLMTCAGTWNPIAQDYSDRLWVVAEPPGIVTRAARTPTPAAMSRFAQVSPAGGLGNTDLDLEETFGPPTGESSEHLAVYKNGRRADLAITDSAQTRALLVGAVQPKGSPLGFDAAVKLTRQWLPRDATPRGDKPEGNQTFVVERFSSALLAQGLPAKWFTDRNGQPGDFVIVYARQSDGRITAEALGIGDDAQPVLDQLLDKPAS